MLLLIIIFRLSACRRRIEQIEQEDSDDVDVLITKYIHMTYEQAKETDVVEIETNIAVHEHEISTLKKSVDVSAIARYIEKETEYKARVHDLDDATSRRDAARYELESIKSKRHKEFMEGFTSITNKLKEMYQMITLGGDAELELVDTLDPFTEGVVFRYVIIIYIMYHHSVRPPKKSWKNISNLSGGEKTLSSLSLVFALHQYKPTPIYVMDEVC